MTPAPRARRFAAWLALLGLLLQIGLSTAHSARHLDHLVGPFGLADLGLAADDPATAPHDSPAPSDPKRCAVDPGLAAAGFAVLAEPARLAVRSEFHTTRLEATSRPVLAAAGRHNLPPARAPPVIAIVA